MAGRRVHPFYSTLLVSCLASFFIFYLYLRPHYRQPAVVTNVEIPKPSSPPEPPPCPSLPGIEDVLVVVKTGATEVREKLPVHFNTTLSCIPNWVVFSDLEEDIEGHHVYNALRNVSQDVRNKHADFDIYNRLQQFGREGLQANDWSDKTNGMLGNPENPGWRLDKWKFLPLMNEVYEYQSDAKWYVFMEADTYVVWHNLLAWLSRLDPKRPHYLGAQAAIGDIIFGHGGSGFIMSNLALRRVSTYHSARREDLDQFTAEQWAGDCVLGKALVDVGAPLTWSWPMLQGDLPTAINYFAPGPSGKVGCYPAVTYHHMTPAAIRDMWEFEQSRRHLKNERLLLHREVFKHFVGSQIATDRGDWDNGSADLVELPGGVNSTTECQAICQDDEGCMQFSYSAGDCFTSKVVKLGAERETGHSGWMHDRIVAEAHDLDFCRSQWIMP